MTVAAVLVAYAAGLGVLGPRMLGRARWTARAPMLAMVTYLAAGWSVIAALGLAGLTLAVHATALGGGLSDLIGACVHRLQATYGTPGRRHGRRARPHPGRRRRRPHRAHRDDPLPRHRAAGAAARADRAAGRASRARPGGGARGACPARCLLCRRPAAHGDPDHRRGAGAGSRPAGCGAGARASAPGRPSSLAGGHGEDRPRGAPVPAADAGRRGTGRTAGRTARRRCGYPSSRSPAAGHRPGRAGHRRPVPRRPWPRGPPTRSSGFTGSWGPASHWERCGGSCSGPPPRRWS